MKKATRFAVNIREWDTEEIVRTLYADTERAAGKLDDGIAINLDHDRFYTEIAVAA